MTAKPRRASLLPLAVACSLSAAASLVVTTALIAEIAATPTAGEGIASSFWTPATAVAALVFGSGAFHGSLQPLPVLAGWAIVALASLAVGLPGVALIVYSIGWNPPPPAAAIFGVAWGIACEIVVVNLLVNWLQSDDGVYRSLPSWGWWLGMGAWGATLGLVLAWRGRAAAAREGERALAGGAAA
ncbi:MAG: hypothetical protein AB7V58_03245 [Solirubrobacterales bacterium]